MDGNTMYGNTSQGATGRTYADFYDSKRKFLLLVIYLMVATTYFFAFTTKCLNNGTIF